MSGNRLFKKGKLRREKEAGRKREFEARVALLNSKYFKTTSKKWDRNTKTISREILFDFYVQQNKSMAEIGKIAQVFRP